MDSILSDYFFTGGEVLVFLVLVGGAGIAVLWVLWRHWRNRLGAMEQEVVDTRTRYDREYFRVLHDHLQSAISHEIVKGLDFISKKSQETLEELGEQQTVLRDKQHRITAKASEMTQHAVNILHLFAPEPDELQREFLSVRSLVEGVLLELYPYAQSQGVALMPDLHDMEPVAFNRDLVLQAVRNVIHNAVKYSPRGRAVEVDLYLDAGGEGPGGVICVDARDSGIGIREEDQDKIFELSTRADGLIEPGSGIGLYLAREAARSQGGDLILVRSGLNQGSMFRIIFPYSNSDLGE